MNQQITPLLPIYQQEYSQYLKSLIPQSWVNSDISDQQNITSHQYLFKAIKLLAAQTFFQSNPEIDLFCKQIGLDRKKLTKIDTFNSRLDYIVNAMNKSIQDQTKKVKNNIKNYVNSKNSKKQLIKTNKVKDDFSWLSLKSKYPKLQVKLKSKIIQSINEQKNEKIIRNHLIMKQQEDYKQEKVQLEQDSLFMQEYQKGKIEYQWNQKDEQLLIRNINSQKKKCKNNSEFLKVCGRFKFISQKQFQTLAAQQISRKLDKSNKIYLSRQFLLDKYFSTTQILNEQQIRFILKTSPMLSKCVDRSFIKIALKNIQYQQIAKIQLKIAEDIISRFQQIRNSVRQSRKKYKQIKNNQTKQRIFKFQKAMQDKIIRQIAKKKLQNHKVSLFRSINYQNKAPNQFKNLQKLTSPKNKSCKPLNKFHPTSGLFVKDCNQQCNDDLYNIYQTNYINSLNEPYRYVKSSKKQEMIQFYTGGPDDNILTTFNQTQTDIISICKLIKSHYFQKCLSTVLQSIDLLQEKQGNYPQIDQNINNIKNKGTSMDLKTKKYLATQEDVEQILKKRLLQNKQKAKSSVYINKLLILCAENAFLNLKALNPKFNYEEVNTKDKKGNTALFYACKHQNIQMIDFLLKFGADPNIPCQKNNTPLHIIFRSNKLFLILKLLAAQNAPNLNCLNFQLKTPLAYCSRQVLKKLALDEGIVRVNNDKTQFNNNLLLQRQQFNKIKQDCLQFNIQLGKEMNSLLKQNKTKVTSIQNI